MLDIAQAHHPVGQQFQRPALPPIGSLATREMDQLGFSLAIQAAPFGPFAREASGESYFQVLLHKALLDTNHGATTDGEHLGNVPIGVAGPALTLIAHQEDAGEKARVWPGCCWYGSPFPESFAARARASQDSEQDSEQKRRSFFSSFHRMFCLRTFPKGECPHPCPWVEAPTRCATSFTRGSSIA